MGIRTLISRLLPGTHLVKARHAPRIISASVRRDIFPLAVIVLLEALLFFTNVQKGTYFLGWDNLFPEMNFEENIHRSIFSVWQQYRGLGVVDAMSYAANLPHYLFLWMLSWVMPIQLLRYFFFFLMHLIGGIGAYALIRETLKHWKIKTRPGTSLLRGVALVGALFYQYNIATVQMFYAPYELFAVHFAFVPVLLLCAWRFLQTGNRRDAVYFSLATVAAIPQAHVPTIFLVYLMTIGSFIGMHVLHGGIRMLPRAGMIVLLTFLINAYWMLPWGYAVATQAATVSESKINQMSTEDIYLRNKAFGDFKSTVLLKGFSLDYVDAQTSDQFDYMMKEWRGHANSTGFLIAGYSFFVLAVVGILAAMTQRQKAAYAFFPIGAFTFIMLGNDIPGVKVIVEMLQTSIPLFFQIFRITFTKFSLVYALCYSVFLSWGIFVLLTRWKMHRIVMNRAAVLGVLMVLYQAYPSWQGYFFYGKLRVQVPEQYFQLVEYFRGQPKEGRVLVLPQPSFWGWTYTSWGYRGSGFLWYGIPQPTMDGAFNPWSRENENFYAQLSQAVYSDDPTQLEQVLQKYQIRWVVIDDSTVNPEAPDALRLPQLRRTIHAMPSVKETATSDFLHVYAVDLVRDPKQFVFLADQLPKVAPRYAFSETDPAFAQVKDYVSPIAEEATTNTYYYPFRSLYTGRKQNELEFEVREYDAYVQFTSNIPPAWSGATLIVPSLSPSPSHPVYPQIAIDGAILPWDRARSSEQNITLPVIKRGVLTVRIPKEKLYDSTVENDLLAQDEGSCDTHNTGISTREIVRERDGDFLKMTSIHSSNCVDIVLRNLSHQSGYLVTMQTRWYEGQPLLFWVINTVNSRIDLQTYAPKESRVYDSAFVIPPRDANSSGYQLHFDTVGLGRQKSVNSLGNVRVYRMPYHFLSSLRAVRMPAAGGQKNTAAISVDHPNPSLYSVTFPQDMRRSNKTTVVLSQAYHQGWIGYDTQCPVTVWNTNVKCRILSVAPFLGGTRLPDHTMVNNWENAWQVSETPYGAPPTVLSFVFLPQYLEYAGFFLLFLVPFSIQTAWWNREFITASLSKVVYQYRGDA